MRASELFVRCLENEGVDTIFGLPGEENMDFLDALADSPIRFVTVRHEQGAALMADVYGRLTGRAGVCLATLGPGATNLVTGVADAFLDRAPMVAITGQAPLSSVHKESHQYIDVVATLARVTKWNVRVALPEVIPEVVRKAFKLAQMEKPGPTHVELPEDIAAAPVDGEPLPVVEATLPEPHPRPLAEAVRILSEAEYPLVLAGNGVLRQRASAALRRLVDKLNVPVASTFMGKGSLSCEDPRNLMAVGLQSGDYANCGIDRADVVLAVGYDLVEYAPRYWNPRADKTLIHVDTEPAETDRHYQPAVELVGDLEAALAQLAEAVDRRFGDDYTTTLREAIEQEIGREVDRPAMPIKPQYLVHTLRRVMDRDDILISDVGAHKLWIARMFPAYEPNTVIISNGFAAMGIALPGAIAAKLVRPQRRVVAVCGDGGFLMNVQELETAVRLRSPLVAVICNDAGYGAIRWKQMHQYGRTFGTDFANPDLVALAASFGARGVRIERADRLEPALREALRADVPVILDVPIDYRENLKLVERLGQLVCPA